MNRRPIKSSTITNVPQGYSKSQDWRLPSTDKVALILTRQDFAQLVDAWPIHITDYDFTHHNVFYIVVQPNGHQPNVPEVCPGDAEERLQNDSVKQQKNSTKGASL